MKYIDTGRRDSSQALATWVDGINPDTVSALRFQTGFFGIGGADRLMPILDRLRNTDGVVHGIVGSNESGTGGNDVHELIAAIGIPRANGQLGVCAFGAGFFHPKVVHFVRKDGTQAAYVGSANLTDSGVRGAHVEAGILLDSYEGDSDSELSRIASAIEAWFSEDRPGFHLVDSISRVDELVARGVLSKVSHTSETRPPPKTSTKGSPPRLPKLAPLVPPLLRKGRRRRVVQPSTSSKRPAKTRATSKHDTADFYFMELSKNRPGSKSYQAEISKDPFLNFFGGKPNASIPITLTHVREDGSKVVEHRHLVNVKSQNYRVEIGALGGKPYPAGRKRPIVAFRRLNSASYNYMLFLPADATYLDASSVFAAAAVSGKIRRAMVTKSVVQSVWPECPLLR